MMNSNTKDSKLKIEINFQKEKSLVLHAVLATSVICVYQTSGSHVNCRIVINWILFGGYVVYSSNFPKASSMSAQNSRLSPLPLKSRRTDCTSVMIPEANCNQKSYKKFRGKNIQTFFTISAAKISWARSWEKNWSNQKGFVLAIILYTKSFLFMGAVDFFHLMPSLLDKLGSLESRAADWRPIKKEFTWNKNEKMHVIQLYPNYKDNKVGIY